MECVHDVDNDYISVINSDEEEVIDGIVVNYDCICEVCGEKFYTFKKINNIGTL